MHLSAPGPMVVGRTKVSGVECRDLWVLHLDDDALAGARQRRPVGLRDGRRADGLRLERLEEHRHWQPDVALDDGGDLGQRAGRHAVLQRLKGGGVGVLKDPGAHRAGELPDLDVDP